MTVGLLLAVLTSTLLGSSLTAPSASAAQGAPETRITFGPAGWVNLTNPVFRYESSDPEARFECRLDSAPFEPCGLVQEEARGDGPEEKLTQGRHRFEVRAVNAAGVADPTPAGSTIIVDTDYPTARILRGPPAVTRARRPKFRLKVAGENSFWCVINGRTAKGKRVRIKVRSCDGHHSFRPPRPLADGRYRFRVVAFDWAGNEPFEFWEFRVLAR